MTCPGDANELPPLDEAATWLLAVGCSDPYSARLHVRLRCLCAADLLHEVGAQPRRTLEPFSGEELRGALFRGIAALDQLPDDIRQSPAVVEATQLAAHAFDNLD
jgi:hypothetical protein